MKTNKAIVLLILAIVLTLVSCDRNKVYEEYVEFDEIAWGLDNPVNFEFEVEDTVGLHNVYINVRHANLYQFNNLWMFVTSSAPNGTINVDTVECVLADIEGKWLGEGLGDIWDIQIPWKQNVRFPYKGKYRVECVQGMRIDKLPGIMGIGLRVETADEK